LKDGSVFQKLPAMIRLKGDIEALKEDKNKISLRVDNATADLKTIATVAKQDVSSLKSAVSILKDGEKSRIEKIIAVAPILKKTRDDAKAARDLVGDPESKNNLIYGILGLIIGGIKGYMGGKK